MITEYSTRLELLKYLPKNIISAELGVFMGLFSKQIIKTLNPIKHYMVDIWDGEMTSGDKDGNNIIQIKDMNDIYLNLKNEYIDNNQIEIIKDKSQNFLKNISDDYFDFIYVDGDHTYSAVYQDMILSLSKIKNNGFLCGHDYIDNYEVQHAVNDFCKNFNQKISGITKDGCPSFLIVVNK
jgi:hypothetical protein